MRASGESRFSEALGEVDDGFILRKDLHFEKRRPPQNDSRTKNSSGQEARPLEISSDGSAISQLRRRSHSRVTFTKQKKKNERID